MTQLQPRPLTNGRDMIEACQMPHKVTGDLVASINTSWSNPSEAFIMASGGSSTCFLEAIDEAKGGHIE